jgi:hypothetical protein
MRWERGAAEKEQVVGQQARAPLTRASPRRLFLPGLHPRASVPFPLFPHRQPHSSPSPSPRPAIPMDVDDDEQLDYGGADDDLRPGEEQEDAVSLGSGVDDEDDAPAYASQPSVIPATPLATPSHHTASPPPPVQRRRHQPEDMDTEGEPGAYSDSPPRSADAHPLTHALPSKPMFYARAPIEGRPRDRDYERPQRRYADDDRSYVPKQQQQDWPRERRARSPYLDSRRTDTDAPAGGDRRPLQSSRPPYHQGTRDYRPPGGAPDAGAERGRIASHDQQQHADRQFYPGPGSYGPDRPPRGRSFSPPRRPRDWDDRVQNMSGAREDYTDDARQTRALPTRGRDGRGTNRAADWAPEPRRHSDAEHDDLGYSRDPPGWKESKPQRAPLHYAERTLSTPT